MLLAVVLCCTARASSATADDPRFASEPDEEQYYGSEIPRVKELTRAAFDKFVAEGRPVVVQDATRGLPMEGWTCDYISQRFKRGRLRREYDWEANPRDINNVAMGDNSWTTDNRVGLGSKGEDKSPKTAPFYWGIRDHFHGVDVGDADMIEEVLGQMATPYFADDSAANLRTMKQQSEFWFSAPGAGAKAHMDSHCISTLSINLSGRRQYRLPPVPRPARRSIDVLHDDGYVYEHGWTPRYEFNVTAGEAVLFPPGWLHETRNTGDECAASLTHQFAVPAPAAYWRTWLPRLTRTGDLSACWNEIATFAGLGAPPNAAEEAGGNGARGIAAADAVFAAVDTDGNGALSLSELTAAGRKSGQAAMLGSAAHFGRGALAYHDLDDDGAVSAAEYRANRAEWTLNQWRVAAEQPLDGPGGDGGQGGDNEAEDSEGEDDEEERRDPDGDDDGHGEL